MKLNLIPAFIARPWLFLMSALLVVVMSACGGGNGSAGDPIGPPSGPSITLSLVNMAGQSVDVIPAGSFLFVQARVAVDSFGNPPPASQLVVFSISRGAEAGVLSPSNGFEATDTNGLAQIQLFPGVSGATGEITATATIKGTTVSSTIAFSSQ